jgi:hypothetical protein
MDASTDLSQLDDPAFLAERARVRETIEALQERMAELNEEFDRRAGAKWRADARCARERQALPPLPRARPGQSADTSH